MNNSLRFIDGTVIGVSRPSGYMKQLIVHNGHKHKHALKYQAIRTPNGMIIHAYGPVGGRRHDWYLYHCSNIESNLQHIYCIETVGSIQFVELRVTIGGFLCRYFSRAITLTKIKPHSTCPIQISVL